MRLPALVLFFVLFGLVGCGLLDRPVPTPDPIPTAVATAAATAAATTAPAPTDAPATPLPTATAEPIATYDPRRAGWTVLVYMNGDNGLDPALLPALLALESAAGSDEVQIVVQLDRRAAAPEDGVVAGRYRLAADGTEGFDGQLLEALEEPNMGRAESVADFIAWGAATAPANRYALLLWGPGAGWTAVTVDDNGSDAAEPDRLLVPELVEGLAAGREAAGLARLDLIAFGGSLMAQLEVLHALQPHARAAVAAPDLLPVAAWPYAAWPAALARDPQQDGRAAATAAVALFETGAPAAVDLDRLPGVVEALDVLAVTLQVDPRLAAPAVAAARGAAPHYGPPGAEALRRAAAVDLVEFARQLGGRALSAPVVAAAERLATVAAGAVAAGDGGISFYFPGQAELLAGAYPTVAPSRTWSAFLNAYYTALPALTTQPAVGVFTPATAPVSVQNPAYLGVEIAGRGVEEVAFLAALETEDGRRRLLVEERLAAAWPDGLYDDFFVWHPEAGFVTDGESGGFAYLEPLPGGGWAARGAFQERGGASTPARLLFAADGALAGVWQTRDGVPLEFLPGPGDTFRLAELYLEQDGALLEEPGADEQGAVVAFRDAGPLRAEWRPAPAGTYQVGFRAGGGAGQEGVALTPVVVANEELVPGYRAYRDPYLGHRFFYPATWPSPAADAGLCGAQGVACTANPERTQWLYIYAYPDFGGTAAALQARTLDDFGAVSVRYEDVVPAGDGETLLRTVYSYEDGSGERTGVFLTAVREGTGFVLDLDGPADLEQETVALAGTLAQSWGVEPAGFQQYPGQWSVLAHETCAVPSPAGYTLRESGGWCVYNGGGGTFLALRREPMTATEGAGAALNRWLATTDEQPGFAAAAPEAIPLAGAVWERAAFSWNDDGRAIDGAIMVTRAGDAWVVAWYEAPADAFADTEREIFAVMVAEYVR